MESLRGTRRRYVVRLPVLDFLTMGDVVLGIHLAVCLGLAQLLVPLIGNGYLPPLQSCLADWSGVAKRSTFGARALILSLALSAP